MNVPQSARRWLVASSMLLVVASSGSDDPPPKAQTPAPKGGDRPVPPALPPIPDLSNVPDVPPPPPGPAETADSLFKIPITRPPVSSGDANLAALATIKPIPPAAIPDDPPPHEGALIDIPYIIEPPDLLVVEVLEALPGRPIQGDHLVRPDGTVNLGFYGEVHVKGLSLPQAKAKIILHLRKYLSDESLGLSVMDIEGTTRDSAPEESDRAFVDIGAYNSKVYFVTGDVGAPGRLPITGFETVLDAVNWAGGLTETADTKNIRVARPARGGKPAKVFEIDYEGIVDRGDSTANLQIFPGDRLIIGRDETVQRTIAINRKVVPLNTALNSLLTYSFAVRNLGGINLPPNATTNGPKNAGDGNAVVDRAGALTPAEVALRDARLRAAVDFLWKFTKPDAPALTEQEFREALLRIVETMPPKP